ncbi:MAG: tetratricopeptide repeat protein [Pseudonocardiaceae bacterium]
MRQENRRLNLLKIGDLEVRASFSLSYEGLTPSLQHAFRLTGVLPLEFSAWALAAVTDGDVDNAEELLEHLADAQLVEINGMDTTGLLRYTLHDLLRDFARECFAEAESAGARHTVLSALLDQYIAMAAVGAETLQPGAHTAPSAVVPLAAATVRSRPRQWFSVERANLISLVQTAHDTGLWERTWQLAQLLPAMFDWRADWQAWEQTQQLALTAARNASDIVAETIILCGLGSLQRELGQFDSAVAMLTKSAELGKQQGDEAWAKALHHLGDTYRYQGLLNEAISTFTTAINVFQRLDDQRSIAGCLNGRGDAQRGLSRWTESEQDIRQAIELYRGIDDPIEVARAIIRYAMVFRDRSHYDKSAPLFNEALETFRELADRRWEAQALRHLGVIRRQQGEIDTAIRLLSQCLLIFDELVDRRGMACTIRNRGDAYRWAEDYDNATADLQQALRIFTEIGDRRWRGRTQLGLAGINRANQNWDQALSLARGALDIFTDIGDRPGQGRAYRDIGIILRDQGRNQEAVEALSRSRELYQSLGDELWVARVLTAEGRHDEAADLCHRNDITDPDTIAIVLKEW